MTALERRILAALKSDHRAAVLLLGERIVQREQRTTADPTNKQGD